MESKLNFAHVCDFAFNGEEGKLCIIGVFKNIFLRDILKPHAQMFVVTNILTNGADNFHKQEIKLVKVGENEDVIKPISLDFSLKENASQSPEVEIGAIAQFNNIQFPEFGKYSFKIFFDEEFLGEVPISINPLKSK